MMTTLDWALMHYDYGYCPIPSVVTTSKDQPRACHVAWKQYQNDRPSRETVADWFSEPNRNISLVCGTHHGLLVIDADDDDAIRYAFDQFPDTPYRVKTNKGMHFFYRMGTSVDSRVNVFGGTKNIIDTRGDKGIIAALGSKHWSGSMYALDKDADLVSIHDLPVFDARLLPVKPVKAIDYTPREVSGTNLERARRYADAVDGAGSGGRSNAAFKLAATITRGFSIDHGNAMPIMLGWNDRCDPPLSHRELDGIVKSAASTGKCAIGSMLG